MDNPPVTLFDEVFHIQIGPKPVVDHHRSHIDRLKNPVKEEKFNPFVG